MQWITRLFDKTGAFGTVVAVMECAYCFPAIYMSTTAKSGEAMS